MKFRNYFSDNKNAIFAGAAAYVAVLIPDTFTITPAIKSNVETSLNAEFGNLEIISDEDEFISWANETCAARLGEYFSGFLRWVQRLNDPNLFDTDTSITEMAGAEMNINMPFQQARTTNSDKAFTQYRQLGYGWSKLIAIGNEIISKFAPIDFEPEETPTPTPTKNAVIAPAPLTDGEMLVADGNGRNVKSIPIPTPPTSTADGLGKTYDEIITANEIPQIVIGEASTPLAPFPVMATKFSNSPSNQFLIPSLSAVFSVNPSTGEVKLNVIGMESRNSTLGYNIIDETSAIVLGHYGFATGFKPFNLTEAKKIKGVK